MAADAGRVRVEEQLRIKIGEAKNLPPRSHGAPLRDIYCRLSLDQEEIFRTSTVERTLNPYFGEEFQFEVPRGFRYLSIYVLDRDRQYKQDKVVGKVAIRREELKKYEKDNWFSLRPVDADSEVQGKAHIEILFEDSAPKITSLSTEDEHISEITKLLNFNIEQDAQMEVEAVNLNVNIDRKTSKSKHISKMSDCYKDNVKYGSYSSTSSKKLFSHVPENTSMSLNRSESLRTGQVSFGHHTTHNTYGPSNSKNPKRQLPEFPDGVQIRSKNNEHFYPSSESNLVLTKSESGNIYDYQLDLKNKLSVRVIECSELTLKNGQCDPHAEVTVYYKNGKKVSKRTKSKKKTVNPKFDECFVFDLTLENNTNKDRESSNNTYIVWPAAGWDDGICEVCISLYHDTFFLGEVRLPLQTPEHRANINSKAWYLLGSRQGQQAFSHNSSGSNGYEIIRGSTPSGTQLSSITPGSLGSLRLLLHHKLDRVLPRPAYDDLRSLILSPAPHKPITSSAVFILGEVFIRNTADIAQPLVRLFTHADFLIPIVKALADAELSNLKDVTTIFRGNSLVSKMMDEAMKLTGLSYLKCTLTPILDTIFLEKKSCEIDPTKVKDQSTIETNLSNLKEYVEKMFEAITQSFVHCPGIMCRLFHALRQSAAQKFPQDPGVKYSVVSSFIFLRFFAPAILGPRLFNISSEQIDPGTNRTLTLISKTIITLGNLVSSRSSQQVCKEEYMGALYNCFNTERHVHAIKQYLEIISSSAEANSGNFQDTPVLLKEGVMIKRTQRPRRFLRTNLKKRHFRLTNRELSYSKSRGKRSLCSIPLADIVAVEPVSEVNNLKMNNMFQIVYKERTLYVQANNCVERKEWLDMLGKLCEKHSTHPQLYHRATYMYGRWNCCKATNEDAKGCATVASRSTIEIHLPLDPDRDLQRIHCLLYSNIAILEKLSEIKSGTSITTSQGLSIDDPKSYLDTLKKLKNVTYCLEDTHRANQRSLERETKYGSKQAPIGDDNYLHLASRNTDPSMRSVSKYSPSAIESDLFLYGSPKINHLIKNSQMSCSISPKSLPRFVNSDKKPLQFSTSSNVSDTGQSDHIMLNLKSQSQKNFSFSDKDLLTTSYLNNSLYIASSESDKISSTNSEEIIPKIIKSDDCSNGYLKMLSVRNGCDTDNLSFNQNFNKCLSPLKTSDQVKNEKLLSTSTSEYVAPNLAERDIKNNAKNSPIGDLNSKSKMTLEEMADSPQHYCKEYELMADFRSHSKDVFSNKQDNDRFSDIPPAIPPRNQQTISPSYTKYKKPSSFSKTNVKEYKSLDHYQLKTLKSPDGRKSPKIDFSLFICDKTCTDNISADVSNCKNIQESSDVFPVISSHDNAIFDKCDLHEPNAETELKIPSCASTDIIERSVLSDNFQHRHSDSSKEITSNLVLRKNSENASDVDRELDAFSNFRHSNKDTSESKEDGSIFSRKDVQRKSIPSKSKLSNNKKTNSVDGSCASLEGSSRSQTPLSNLLTPSFLKKKTKVNT